MQAPQKVFLVGPMGAGKTTIGRHLAKKLNFKFLDLDAEIEKSCGADIAWIFDVEGEEGFRKRESALLEELTNQPEIVLATGGGAVLNPENRRALASRGTVIYLKASVDQLYQRTRHDKKRPLLQVDDVRQAIEELLNFRDPLYSEVADVVFLTGNQSPQSVAESLEKELANL